ncbi:MAG: FAD:protein FMN transferase [Gammaproteobacteria bacterium]|nr:FAD:protein FMN transferase [Gammaproteobacteria bacterium]
MGFFHASLIAAWALWGALANAAWYEDSQSIMGTRIHAELWSEDAAAAQVVLASIMAEMQRVEDAYSPQIAASELSQLNERARIGWVEVSAELFMLLEKSRHASQITGGAFDITYASVGRYYDYRNGIRPDDAVLAAAVDAINYRYVELDAITRSVRFARPEVYVDLGGIAKGYAVDRCVELMLAAGIEQGSVSAGGDSRILGDRRGKPWTVGVRDPRREGVMIAILPLTNTAVSTSGDYERFFDEDGIRYHHILDPKTGKSAQDSWSVTILGAEATFTDALSTSVFVLGPDKGLELVNRLAGIDAIIIDANGKLRYSAELAPLE